MGKEASSEEKLAPDEASASKKMSSVESDCP
jgi:hypothetical protein